MNEHMKLCMEKSNQFDIPAKDFKVQDVISTRNCIFRPLI